MKSIIRDVLCMWLYKLDNNECTSEELKSAYTAILNNIEIWSSIDDIAGTYGKSKQNVKAVMSQKRFQESNPPKTRKLYNFLKFQSFIPPSWRK